MVASRAARGFSYLIALLLRCVEDFYGVSLPPLPPSLPPSPAAPPMRERKLYSFHYIFYSDNPE